MDFAHERWPSWQPSWILKKPSGWPVATQAKFHLDTIYYAKMQRNAFYQTLRGSRPVPPDYNTAMPRRPSYRFFLPILILSDQPSISIIYDARISFELCKSGGIMLNSA